MPFEEVETKKKSAYIIEQIVAAIQNGKYKVGQKLPAEREIAEKMGVCEAPEVIIEPCVCGIVDVERVKRILKRHLEGKQEIKLALDDSGR